ncbi:MAG TPA: hypothetical protein VFO65_00440 [Acidimicrobiales bacterium]|nr:hypothetical protein [Acidimicrobiales bacterium]
MSAAGEELARVRILQYPLDVHERTTESVEGLRREFALIAIRSEECDDVPVRLQRLIDVLGADYGDFSEANTQLIVEAIGRGETVIDELVFELPRHADQACVALARMLDEADDYCRRGDFLLSLASPPEAVAFRRWYLGEFIAQLHGGDPVPWPEADHAALAASPALRGMETGTV